jgi:hypothetical protein
MKVSVIVLLTVSIFGVTTSANAGGASAVAPGQNKAALSALYGTTGSPTPGGTVDDNLGQAISGGFYGNTSNSGVSPYAPSNGNGVTPSISPGPQTVGGGGPGTGSSIGDTIQFLRCLMAPLAPNCQ